MLPAIDVDLAALTPALAPNQVLLDYWRKLQATGPGAPARARFDPMAVPRLLPNIMLLERSDDGELTVRIMGTALAERHTTDLTGQPLLPSLPELLRKSAAASYAEVTSLPCVHLLRRRIHRTTGTTPLVEVLHLPLADPADRVVFVITAVWELDPPVDHDEQDWQHPGERQRALL